MDLIKKKKLIRSIQRAARSKKKNKEEKLKGLYQELTEFVQKLTDRCKDTIATAQKIRRKRAIVVNMMISELEDCIAFTEKQCALAYRRVILDKKISHDEKVFSYFEPHTELINRGKTPYPIEFGHRVLVIQDRAGFILKSFIMDHTTDDKVLIPQMKKLQEQYGGKIKSRATSKSEIYVNNQAIII